MVLGQGEKLCQFEEKDLYVPVELKSYDTFPKENLVERVTRRKAISFEAEAVEQYKKDKLEKAQSIMNEQLSGTSNAADFLTEINRFISNYKQRRMFSRKPIITFTSICISEKVRLQVMRNHILH